jgi:hypothetical protein
LLRGFLQLTVVVLVLMLSVAAMPVRVFAVATADEARAAVDGVQAQIITCYGAVAEAESAGANVTGLLVTLNEAGWLLSRAHLAYETGNFSLAVSFAEQSRARLDGFVGGAEVLKKSAAETGYWDFVVNVVGSSVGAVAVVVGGFVLWSFLKRKYDRGEAHLQQ